MGFFNRRGRRTLEDIARSQEDMQAVQRRFQQEVRNQLNNHEKRISELENQIIEYKNTINGLNLDLRSLRRDKSEDAEKERKKIEMKKHIEEMRKEELEREKAEEERRIKLSEQEMKEAKEEIKKLLEQVKSAIATNDSYTIEKLEKKYDKNILVFKARVGDKVYREKTIKQVKAVALIIFALGEFYFKERKFDKALKCFQEAENFSYEKNDLFYRRMIKTCCETGSFEEALKYIENYNDESVAIENLLKLEIYIAIKDNANIEKIIKEQSQILKKESDKNLHIEFITLIEKYLEQSDSKEAVTILFFEWLYLKNFGKIKENLDKYDFPDKEFFEGLILIREKNDEGLTLIRKYISSIYGASFYFSRVKENFADEDLEYLNKFLKAEINEESSFIFSQNNLYNKKYEFLSYKIERYLDKKEIELEEIIKDIEALLDEDDRASNYKGNDIFWHTLIKLALYLKQVDNPKYKDIEEKYEYELSQEEIKTLEKSFIDKDEISIDIEEEYTLGKLKNEISLYKDIECKNKSTSENKVLVEIVETMNSKIMQEKKTNLLKDQENSKESKHILKIDNFSVTQDKICIITEDYDKLYEEASEEYLTLTFAEKIDRALNMVEAFIELEEKELFMLKLNIDNLVIKDENYKFRFLSYTETLENGSLSSSKSAIAKKSNKYRAPQVTLKDKNKKSNIYILGLLLYDIFYNQDILTGIINPEISLLESGTTNSNLNKLKMKQERINSAFFEERPIDRLQVSYVDSSRFYGDNEENNTVMIQKVVENPFIPKELTNLLQEILSFATNRRPKLEDIYERLQNISEERSFIPSIISKDKLEELIKSLGSKIRYVKIREKEYKDIYKETIYNDQLEANIVIGIDNERELELSDIGNKFAVAIVTEEIKEKEKIMSIAETKKTEKIKSKSEQILDKLKSKSEQILEKLEKYTVKELAQKLDTDEENAEIFKFLAEGEARNFKSGGVINFDSDIVGILEKIPVIPEKSKKEIAKNNAEEFIKVMEKII